MAEVTVKILKLGIEACVILIGAFFEMFGLGFIPTIIQVVAFIIFVLIPSIVLFLVVFCIDGDQNQQI
jgi:hypothetical protein